MKTRFLLLLVAGFFTVNLFASPVNIETAKKVAQSAYFEKISYFTTLSPKDFSIGEVFNYKQDGETMFYIFNIEPKGFIIVSAEDAMQPILGYGFESTYNEATAPKDNFAWLMKNFAGSIKSLRETNTVADNAIMLEWNRYIHFDFSQPLPQKAGKDVEPLLSCTWNQDWPYNYYCPVDPQGPGGHVYVGCVATAMAQIMYYYRYPIQGTGSHSYYATGYGQQTANFGSTTYDWDGMTDNGDQYVNLPICLIGYHCGVAVDMQYGWDGSGAYSDEVPYAVKTYFGYSTQCVYNSLPNNPTSGQLTNWKNLIKDELNISHPIYYSGTEPGNGGHAFVCDGYHNADDMFHFNFGWSGYMNGFFPIVYNSGGVGGFYFNQGMVRNFFPNANYPYNCSGTKEYHNLTGSFEDGSSPLQNYMDNINCQWLIDPQTAQDSVTKITLGFISFDTEANNDVVTIYDGPTTTSPVLGTFSGSSLPAAVTSTGNKMLVVFTTNGSVNATGWKAYYNTTLPSYCSGLLTLTDPTGTLNDGSNDFYYKNSTNCMWKIQPQYGVDLTLSFTEFDTEENVDLVKIYDATNNQLLATYSGTYTAGNMPPSVTSPGGKLFITFQSDQAMNGSGFTADWYVGNTGVHDVLNVFKNLSVYPVPVKDELKVSFSMNKIQNIEITIQNMAGQVLYTERENGFSGNYINTIDMGNFSKGVYTMLLKSDEGIVTRKIIVE